MNASNVADIGEGVWEDLSNFTPRNFIFRDLEFASMEGLLQSLKFPLLSKQARLRTLSGIKAKRLGQKKKWYLDHTLYWLDSPISRHSNDYMLLVNEAFDAMYEQNQDYQSLLSKTKGLILIHSHGKSDPNHTILTELEFTNILERLRA
jgi:hypothetical protein